MRATASGRSVLPTAIAMASVWVLLIAAGQSRLWLSSDTPSYLVAATSAAPLAEIRLPVYGWLIRPLLGLDHALPLLQLGSYFAAGLWLVAALRRAGASQALALAVGLALAASNEALLWGNAALPELPGHAALLAADALVVGLAAGRHGRWGIAGAAGLLTLAWLLRPSLLAFVVLAPLALLMLPRRLPVLLLGRRMALLLLLALLPVLLLSGVRGLRYGSFNIASFGGFSMAGIAAGMLTPELIARLPEAEQPLASAILQRRAALVDSGEAAAIPANSSGQRSYLSAAIGYFDILARSYDPVLWLGIGALQQPGESWPAFDRRLQQFALASFRAAPTAYAAWVIGGTARVVGHALALNLAFLLSGAALCGLVVVRMLGGRGLSIGLASPDDGRILLVLSGLHFLGTAAPAVLIAMPAARYIDSAELFLAAWPIYGLLLMVGCCTKGAPAA